MSAKATEPFDPSWLQGFCSTLLQKTEVPLEDAELIAESLVRANLRGVDSHGVARLAIYIERLKKGLVNPRPRITTVRATPWHCSMVTMAAGR
jgi:LDH2 family malate/lactate/ureidoglycolate dehydrogenase